MFAPPPHALNGKRGTVLKSHVKRFEIRDKIESMSTLLPKSAGKLMNIVVLKRLTAI